MPEWNALLPLPAFARYLRRLSPSPFSFAAVASSGFLRFLPPVAAAFVTLGHAAAAMRRAAASALCRVRFTTFSAALRESQPVRSLLPRRA